MAAISSPRAPRRLFPWKIRQRRKRTPTVLQMEMAECGAAALGMVLAYHGLFIPLEELRIACGVSRDGSKASNMAKAARRFGLTCTAFRRDFQRLKQTPLPAIIHWEFNHFMVLEGIGSKKVWLNDPATGPRTMSHQEFERSYSGIVLTFAPGPDFIPGGRPPNLYGSLARRLAGYGGPLVFLVLASLFLVIPGLAIPAFLRFFVDQVLVRGFNDMAGPLLLGMTAALAMRAFLVWLQQTFLLKVETKLALSTSSRFLWHVLRLPVLFFSQRYAGDISHRVTINDRIARLLSGQLATNFLNGMMIVFFLAVMMQYDLFLSGVAVVLALGNLAALKIVNRLRVDANLRFLQERGKLAGVTMAGLQMIETFKASGEESDFFAQWAGYQTRTINSHIGLGVPTQLLSVVPSLISSLGLVVILILGGARVMEGSLSVGMLVAFQGLLLSFFEPIANLVNLGETLQEVKGDLSRLDDVLRAKLDLPDTPGEGAPKALQGAGRLNGFLELKQVAFGYNPLEEPFLQDISLKLEPGKRVALVGPTGSGKSTLIKLICGIYQPWSGEILLDGKPRGDHPKRMLTNSLALVDQDIFLFEGTVRDNITLWDPTTPEADILAAAKDAAIHEDIALRPAAYDSLVEEDGRNFSGGQRQRLEIARALVNKPSILILDEATSALDPPVEEGIDENLRRRGCACLIAAHRLSTIRDCDEIIVLDKGRVAERGTHQDLWDAGGIYSKLIEN